MEQSLRIYLQLLCGKIYCLFIVTVNVKQSQYLLRMNQPITMPSSPLTRNLIIPRLGLVTLTLNQTTVHQFAAINESQIDEPTVSCQLFITRITICGVLTFKWKNQGTKRVSRRWFVRQARNIQQRRGSGNILLIATLAVHRPCFYQLSLLLRLVLAVKRMQSINYLCIFINIRCHE